MVLLQAVSLPTDTLSAMAPPATSMSLLDILVQGGWIMIPIGLLSLLTIYLIVERLITVQRAKIDPRQIMDRVRDYVEAGDIRGALAYCEAQDKPITRILRRGLERLGRPISEIRDAVEAAGDGDVTENGGH